MSRRNYKTTRNKLENQFYKGFDNGSDKNYNSKIIKTFFVESKKLNEWEKKFYDSIRLQDFNITDNQLNKLKDIKKKYNITDF
jgi:hypothetical protein